MSQEQWGHGFYKGKEAAKKEIQREGPFPVGYFFHIRDANGKIDKQGMVTGRSGDTFIARYFSWVVGDLMEKAIPFDIDDTADWTWYQTAEDMRMAWAKEAGLHNILVQELESSDIFLPDFERADPFK